MSSGGGGDESGLRISVHQRPSAVPSLLRSVPSSASVLSAEGSAAGQNGKNSVPDFLSSRFSERRQPDRQPELQDFLSRAVRVSYGQPLDGELKGDHAVTLIPHSECVHAPRKRRGSTLGVQAENGLEENHPIQRLAPGDDLNGLRSGDLSDVTAVRGKLPQGCQRPLRCEQCHRHDFVEAGDSEFLGGGYIFGEDTSQAFLC